MNHDHPALIATIPASATVGYVVAAWAGWLPPTITIVAGIMAVLWYALQIYESETVQHYVHRKEIRKRHRRRKKHRANPPDLTHV